MHLVIGLQGTYSLSLRLILLLLVLACNLLIFCYRLLLCCIQSSTEIGILIVRLSVRLNRHVNNSSLPVNIRSTRRSLDRPHCRTSNGWLIRENLGPGLGFVSNQLGCSFLHCFCMLSFLLFGLLSVSTVLVLMLERLLLSGVMLFSWRFVGMPAITLTTI